MKLSLEELRTEIKSGTLKNLNSSVIAESISENPFIFHYAAFFGKLNEIPEEFISEEKLSAPDPQGNSVFHYAALSGDLNQIPFQFLTAENLLRENLGGRTVLYYAAETDALKPISLTMFSLKTLRNLERKTTNQKSIKLIRLAIKQLRQN